MRGSKLKASKWNYEVVADDIFDSAVEIGGKRRLGVGSR